MNLLDNISDITMALLGAKLDRERPNSPDSLMALDRLEKVKGGKGLILWTQFFRPGVGSSAQTLLP